MCCVLCAVWWCLGLKSLYYYDGAVSCPLHPSMSLLEVGRGLRRVPDCPSQSWRGRALLNTEMIRAYKHFRKKLTFIKHESKISQISGLNPIKDNFLFRTDWGQWPWSDCGRSNFLCEISWKLLRYKQGWGWNDQRGHQINCVHG